MTASDKPLANAWDDLVYNLFYPSILGSVIFDYADPIRFSLENTDRLFLLPALLAFVIDYWHMKNHIRAHDGSALGLRLIDIGVTVLFLVSYFSFSRALTKDQATNALPPNFGDLLQQGLWLIISALALILFYDLLKFGWPILKRVILSALVLSLVSVSAFVMYDRIGPNSIPIWFRCSSLAMTGLYAVYVLMWPRSLQSR